MNATSLELAGFSGCSLRTLAETLAEARAGAKLAATEGIHYHAPPSHEMDETTMIEAVLWDFGGVLTTSPFEAFNRYEAERGLPRDFIRTINATNPETNAWAQFESSQIDLDAFDAAFAEESEAAGHRVPGADVIALLSGDIRPRMVRILEHCKAHFAVGCITNNVKSGTGPGMARDEVKAARVAEIMALFDLVVESSVEGIRKPNPRIYELACERLGVAADRTVFLDDLGINLKPARALGMQTIKVLNEAQAIEELLAVTGLAEPGKS